MRGVTYKAAVDLHEELNDSSYVLLRANNIQDGELRFDDVQYVDRTKVKQKQLLRRGDILFCASSGSKGLVGKAALVRENMPVTFGAFCCVLRPKENEAEYLAHYFQSQQYRRAIEKVCSGSNINNLKAANFFSLVVPHYDDDSTRIISALFDSIDAQIKHAKDQIANLDSLVKSRFVEMFGSSSADSRYEVCRIGDIADVFVGVVIKPKQYYTDDHANGIKAFRSLNVGEMQVRDDDWVYFSKVGNKKAKKTQLHAGDVLVVRSGYPGTSCVVPLLYEGCNAVDLIIARSNSNNVLPEYIAAFNNGSHMKSLINQMSVGSAQKHFNIGFYRNVEIPLPPLSAQKEYVSFLRQVDKSGFATHCDHLRASY